MALVIHPKSAKTPKKVLSVGVNTLGEVIINHPNLITDPDGQGYIVFTPDQARNLARVLLQQADAAEQL